MITIADVACAQTIVEISRQLQEPVEERFVELAKYDIDDYPRCSNAVFESRLPERGRRKVMLEPYPKVPWWKFWLWDIWF